MNGTSSARHNGKHIAKRALWMVSIIALVYLLLPAFAGNLVLVMLSHSMRCTPERAYCSAGVSDMSAGWHMEATGASGLLAFVEGVRGLAPHDATLKLRHAELLAGRGDYASAAALLPRLTAPVYARTDETHIGVEASRLLVNGTPEYALLVAHQRATAGDEATARSALQMAISTAPTLLGEAEWALYQQLEPLTSASEPRRVAYQLPAPTLWRGMEIVGIEIDVSTLGYVQIGELSLRLRVRTASPPTESVAAGNGEWFIPYHALNRAPNPRFEWGSETVHNGTVPTGYFALYTTGGEQVIEVDSGDGETRLRISGAGVQSISSYPLSAVPDALYLMGTTVSTTGRFTLGRRCVPTENFPRHDLWVNPLREPDVRADWQQLERARAVAHASVTPPDFPYATCQLVLEAQGGDTFVDDVFLVVLQ